MSKGGADHDLCFSPFYVASFIKSTHLASFVHPQLRVFIRNAGQLHTVITVWMPI